MKIDILQAAKNAGAYDEMDWKGRSSITFSQSDLQTFAEIIAMQCAGACYARNTGDHSRECQEAVACGDAIMGMVRGINDR